RLKNEKLRMCARCLLDLAVQIRDPPRATCAAVVRSLAPSPVSPPARLDPEWPAWPGLCPPAALGEFLMPASTLTEELPQLCGPFLLQLLQRKPTLQQVTHQLRVQLFKPLNICGKYTFKYPVKRFSCAVFSSTKVRRSSTRFWIRRVTSLSGVKRRSFFRCCNNRSSSSSASRGSSLDPDGYSDFRMLADMVEGTGNRCKHSYLLSMYTSAPFLCSTATAIGPGPNRWASYLTHASTISGVCSTSPCSRCVEPALCQ